MSQALATQQEGAAPAPNRERALKILSKSIYRELRQNGYEPKQIVAMATEIISKTIDKPLRFIDETPDEARAFLAAVEPAPTPWAAQSGRRCAEAIRYRT